MNVAVLSAHKLTRKAFCALLASMRDLHVVLDTDNGLDHIELIQRSRPDILLMDTGNSASDLEMVSHVRKLVPEVKLLLLSDGADEEFQYRAVRTGAHGCVSKSCEPPILERALKLVGQGEIWVSHRMATHIIGKFLRWQDQEDGNSGELTPREGEILALIANGYRNKEIATRLSVSENTVKAHLFTIYRKLQVSNRLGAALHYFQQAKQNANRPRETSLGAAEGRSASQRPPRQSRVGPKPNRNRAKT